MSPHFFDLVGHLENNWNKQCEAGKVGINYPALVVFDLDACLWDQEMYTMSALPDRTAIGDLNGKPP